MALSGTFFDASYYLAQNSDVANYWSGAPLAHYEAYGAAEGRNPNAWFDAQYYRTTYTDLQNMNALELFQHYETWGYKEGRVVDSEYANFDEAQYLADYTDLGDNGITEATALSHYLQYGISESRVAKNDDGTTISSTTSTTGQTYTLSTGIDNIAGDDKDNTILGDDTTNQVADIINGGGGTDTIKLYDTGTNDITLVGVSNVENVYVHDLGNDLNIATESSVKALELDALDTAIDVTVGAGQTVTFDSTDVNAQTDILSAAAVTSLALVVDGVDVDNAGDEDIDINGTGVTSLSITGANNASRLQIVNTGGALKTVTISGDQNITLTDAVMPNATTIDAAKLTGNLKVLVDNVAATVTGGSGNDIIAFGAAGEYTTADTINGGDGTDVLSVDDADGVTTAKQTNVSNIETLSIASATAASAVYDLAHWGATNINFATTVTGTTYVNNLGITGSTVSLATTSNVDLNATDPDGTSDSLALDLNGAGVTYTVNATGYEALTVNTNDATGTSTLALTDAQLKTISLTNTADQAVDLGTLGTVVAAVDLSGHKAKTVTNGVTVVLSSSAVNGATVTGSANNDAITGSSQNDKINGGAGSDTITHSAGIDTIDLGAGDAVADKFVIGDGTLLAANKFTLQNFNVSGTGIDTIELNEATTLNTGGAGDVSDGMAAGELQSVTSAAATYTLAGGEAAIELAFEFDSDIDLDTANKTEILSALGAANDSTSSSVTAGVLNVAAAADEVLLIMYQSGNAYLFEADGGTGDTVVGDGTGANDAIDLVGVIEGVEVGALSAAHFV